MTQRVLGSLTLALGLVLLLAQSLAGQMSGSYAINLHAGAGSLTPAQHTAIASQYGQLPLAFEMNVGQAAESARFVAHGSGYTLALTPSQALLALSQSSPVAPKGRLTLPGQPAPYAGPSGPRQPPTLLGMAWLGANAHPIVTGEHPLPGTVNYFLGNNPKQWHTTIPTYQQVRLHNVYPGVDLVYYGTNGQLEYDFVVSPGANPAAIRLGFSGDQRLGVDLAGNLSLALAGGAVQQQKPLIYQTVNGARQAIVGGYALAGGGHVGFSLGTYNPHLPLVIDPAYKFSTYFGGSNAYGDNAWTHAIAVDSSGNVYVTGTTDATDFPTKNPLFPTLKGGNDAFVSKFNAAGNALIYSTYLGGSGQGEEGNGIAVDASGNAYVTGNTLSTDFPTTPGAFQTTYIGGASDTFVTKFNATGSALLYSTYLGGSNAGGGTGLTYAYAIAVDTTGNAYITGETDSAVFPITPGAFQTTYDANTDAYVSKLNASGSGLVYSTYLGGNLTDVGYGIAVDASGNAYVTGDTSSANFPTHNPIQASVGGSDDGFVTKLNATGTALVYSTFLGGNSADLGAAIAVDANGNAYVTGPTYSTNFPTHNPFQATNHDSANGNVFVSKLNAAGSTFVYSTYLGGSGGMYYGDAGTGIAADANGNAYVTGSTLSTDFPTANALQSTIGGANGNAFVTKFNATGSALLYSSYLGGAGNAYLGATQGDGGTAIAVGANATVYVTGATFSNNFPIVNAFQTTADPLGTAFVTKLTTRPSMATTTGVFRPSNGALYLKNSNSTGYADLTLYYGKPGDKPVTGDWTGKGYRSIGVDRAGTFYLRNSNTTGPADLTLAFGATGDLPVAGDWTGKGYDSVGVFRNGVFYLRNTNTSGGPDLTVYFGAAGDLPVVGDWTGKGYDSVGVYRPSAGQFYLRNSNTTGPADLTVTFGASGDLPIAGDWTAKGYDSIGLYRSGTYLLRNTNSTGAPDISFTLGIAGDQPIAGPWLALVGGLPPVHRGPHAPGQHMAGRMPTRRSGG